MERIDALQQEHRDLMAGFRSHFGHHAPRKLEEEQSAYFTKLRRGSVEPGMSTDTLATFPGMPNYKGPVS